MSRISLARKFVEKEFSAIKSIALMGAAAIKIPGARKSAGRHLVNKAGNGVLNFLTKSIAKTKGIDSDKLTSKVNSVKTISQDMGAPSLGKLIVNK